MTDIVARTIDSDFALRLQRGGVNYWGLVRLCLFVGIDVNQKQLEDSRFYHSVVSHSPESCRKCQMRLADAYAVAILGTAIRPYVPLARKRKKVSND
jgi:hypothetical protein